MRITFFFYMLAFSQMLVQAQKATSEIAVFNLETNKLIQLTFNDSADEEPEWSPDGSLIIFDSNSLGSNDIYQMKSDGTGISRLTYDNAKEDHAA